MIKLPGANVENLFLFNKIMETPGTFLDDEQYLDIKYKNHNKTYKIYIMETPNTFPKISTYHSNPRHFHKRSPHLS